MPSLSKVAMRSAGSTNSGEAGSVVASTKSRIAVLVSPSFQDGSGSVWADAVDRQRRTRSAAARRIVSRIEGSPSQCNPRPGPRAAAVGFSCRSASAGSTPSSASCLRTQCEPLVVRDGDRPGVAQALQLARRVLDVGLHQLVDRVADRDHRPGALGEVVHEDVVALLRIGPEVEDLRDRRDIALRALPAEVGIDREAAGRCAVVAAQVEDGLEVADAGGARARARPR